MAQPIQLTNSKSEEWMARLLSRAKLIGNLGEVPITSVILDQNGLCIGYGSNRRESNKDPLGHAELIALQQAAKIKDDWRFNECTLIVNLEPCPMCAGALIQARMGQVIYGAKDFKRGALGGSLNLATHKSAHHKMIVQGGILENLVQEQLQNWFKKRRMANF